MCFTEERLEFDVSGNEVVEFDMSALVAVPHYNCIKRRVTHTVACTLKHITRFSLAHTFAHSHSLGIINLLRDVIVMASIEQFRGHCRNRKTLITNFEQRIVKNSRSAASTDLFQL